MSGPYDDILRLPHHVSDKRPRMPMGDRAAQFSPFAALTGYGDAIDETARLTEGLIELTEEEQQVIDRRLRRALDSGESVEITHFVPDARKAGGAYEITAGTIRKLDPIARQVRLTGGGEIPMEYIISVRTPTPPAAPCGAASASEEEAGCQRGIVGRDAWGFPP